MLAAVPRLGRERARRCEPSLRGFVGTHVMSCRSLKTMSGVIGSSMPPPLTGVQRCRCSSQLLHEERDGGTSPAMVVKAFQLLMQVVLNLIGDLVAGLDVA